MLAGAFGAMWATFAFESPWAGLLGGIAGGMLIAALHGVASLKLRANQIVSAIALNLLAAGTTGMLLNQVFAVYGTSPTVRRLPDLAQFLSAMFPDLANSVASFGGRLSVLVPVALVLGLATLGFFRWTTWGLRIRACGENPTAAEAAGIAVVRTRFLVVCMQRCAGRSWRRLPGHRGAFPVCRRNYPGPGIPGDCRPHPRPLATARSPPGSALFRSERGGLRMAGRAVVEPPRPDLPRLPLFRMPHHFDVSIREKTTAIGLRETVKVSPSAAEKEDFPRGESAFYVGCQYRFAK